MSIFGENSCERFRAGFFSYRETNVSTSGTSDITTDSETTSEITTYSDIDRWLADSLIAAVANWEGLSVWPMGLFIGGLEMGFLVGLIWKINPHSHVSWGFVLITFWCAQLVVRALTVRLCPRSAGEVQRRLLALAGEDILSSSDETRLVGLRSLKFGDRVADALAVHKYDGPPSLHDGSFAIAGALVTIVLLLGGSVLLQILGFLTTVGWLGVVAWSKFVIRRGTDDELRYLIPTDLKTLEDPPRTMFRSLGPETIRRVRQAGKAVSRFNEAMLRCEIVIRDHLLLHESDQVQELRLKIDGERTRLEIALSRLGNIVDGEIRGVILPRSGRMDVLGPALHGDELVADIGVIVEDVMRQVASELAALQDLRQLSPEDASSTPTEKAGACDRRC